MVKIQQLRETGIHDVFDCDQAHSFAVLENGETIGYVCFWELSPERIWIEFILAKKRGNGDGSIILQALFDKGYKAINGTAIYGPHFFWKRVGAEFEEEVDEDSCDGEPFLLRKENFRYL